MKLLTKLLHSTALVALSSTAQAASTSCPSGQYMLSTGYPPQSCAQVQASQLGAGALPNGTTATTQTSSDNTLKVATDAFVQAVVAAFTPTNPFALPNGSTATTQTSSDNSTKVATDAFVKSIGYLLGNQTITVSGDISGSGATAITATLPTVNSNVGTYANATVTVNAKGLVTAAVGKTISTNIQKFNSTSTYTPSTGLVFVKFECLGPGGGGGGVSPGASQSIGGGGGGAGGYVIHYLPAASVSGGTVTIGTGGAGGASTGTNGSAGSGSTSFPGICVAGAGSGGGGAASLIAPAGGTGGTATTGDINIVGEAGGAGNYVASASGVPVSGFGGSSLYGTRGTSVSTITGAVGIAATGCGAGGSGGAADGANPEAGGAGANGCVYITEFIEN